MICPACNSEIDAGECFLGNMGPLHHYRCRCCGMMFSRRPKTQMEKQVLRERTAAAKAQRSKP